MSPRILPTTAFLLVGTLSAAAQVVNPADKALQEAQPEEPKPDEDLRLRTWEMSTTEVSGRRLSPLREEDPIGPYNQPRWTARRLFPSTRVYVVPPGVFQLEYWTRVKVPDEGQTAVETQYEAEIGLPHRFQLDLYYVTEKTGSEGELDVAEQKYEIRYALADWGKLWMNPTLYFEYVSRSEEPDKLEYKLLLGDELGTGWHFGSNLVFEHEVSGELENEYELTMGIARTVIDEKLSLGAEMKAALVDVHEDRGDFQESLEIGPSMRWFPIPDMHIDLAPLVGIGGDSRDADIFIVVGWEF